MVKRNSPAEIKILMISTDRSIFEKDSAVRLRLTEQAALTAELHVIVFTPKGEQFKKFTDGKHLHVYPTASVNKFTYLPDAFMLARQILRRSAHKEKWLVSTQDPFESGLLGYLIAWKFRLPLHLQLHTDPFSVEWRTEKFMNRARYEVMLFLLRRASGVRVVSDRVFRSVSLLGVSEERITKVPIFVDVKKFLDAVPAFDLHRSYPEFSRIVLSMGRLQPEKNYRGLIRAFARVRKIHDDAMLLIVGSGPERDRLLSLARSLDLDECVKILPWARDVASYYKSCDLYVQPSLYEGWGLAVIEALASGAPVVMTDVGCAGEVVRNGETGMVVPPRNEQALADAVIRVLGDDTLRAAITTKAKEEVKKCVTKAETLRLYKASWEKAYNTNVKLKDQKSK
jgi:glycosyltransferase involved in cell wall biosynthesis